MAHSRGNALAGQIQMLLETQPDFQRMFKQRLVFESRKVENPFKFIVSLVSKRVLCDDSEDLEANVGLKEEMVRFALMVACSKDGAVGNLMEALEDSGNSELVSALQTWVQRYFGTESDGKNLSEPKGVDPDLHAPSAEVLGKQVKIVNQLSSCGTNLIDKIMSRVQDDFIEELQGHFKGQVSKIVNATEFSASLVHQNVLEETDIIELRTGSEVPEWQQIGAVIQTVFSKKAIASLFIALECSDNQRILVEAYEWLETSHVRQKSYPIAVQSTASQQSQQEPQAFRPAFFEQAALSDGITKLETFYHQQQSAFIGTVGVQFDKERMMALSADGTLDLWNWQGGRKTTIQIAANVKNITCFQYDQEVLILGTIDGFVRLFDARKFHETWSVRLRGRVYSLKFAENKLVTIARNDYRRALEAWVMDISRQDMRLLNRRYVQGLYRNCSLEVSVYPDVFFLFTSNWVDVHDTKSGMRMVDDNQQPCSLLLPATVRTLIVLQLISAKKVVVAGFENGMIAVWNTSKFMCNHNPTKTFKAHSQEIIKLYSLNGHLLSLDVNGKLLMWSGHDLENTHVTPAPRLLIENSNLTELSSHERWFASCSSKDGIINIWTVPDLWLMG